MNTIKALRLQHAWSQEQLAEMAAVSVRTIQRIENGERPGLETLSALAAVFEVSVAELSGEAENRDATLDKRIEDARQQVHHESRFWRSLLTAVVVCALLFAINHFTSPANLWSLWVMTIWGALLFVRGLRISSLPAPLNAGEKRVCKSCCGSNQLICMLSAGFSHK